MSVSINRNQTQGSMMVLTYTEEWTWREANHVFTNALDSVSHVQEPVTLVFDLSDNTYFPSTGLIENIRSAIDKIHTHGNIRMVVVAMPKSSTRDMLMVAVQLYASPNCTYTFATSLNEAYSTISQHFDR